MKKNNRKIKVAVLFGGKSNEHDVSLKSGENVIKNLDLQKYDISPLYISKDGKWYLTRNFLKTNKDFKSVDWIKIITKEKKVLPITDIAKLVEIAFPVLHGGYGENGCIQGFFELIGLKYTGAGILASSMAFDKITAKEMYIQNKIPTPNSLNINKTDWKNLKDKIIKCVELEFGFPCVIKASQSGSSKDMGIPKTKNEATKLIDSIFKNHQSILVEELIKGDEFSCGVLEDKNNFIALPPTQIIPMQSDFFDYKCKYTNGASQEITPANVNKEITATLQTLAVQAHKSLRCKGYSRTDILLRKGKFFVLETNTLPGMTNTSLIPQQAKAAGISYSALLDLMISNELNN